MITNTSEDGNYQPSMSDSSDASESHNKTLRSATPSSSTRQRTLSTNDGHYYECIQCGSLNNSLWQEPGQDKSLCVSCSRKTLNSFDWVEEKPRRQKRIKPIHQQNLAEDTLMEDTTNEIDAAASRRQSPMTDSSEMIVVELPGGEPEQLSSQSDSVPPTIKYQEGFDAASDAQKLSILQQEARANQQAQLDLIDEISRKAEQAAIGREQSATRLASLEGEMERLRQENGDMEKKCTDLKSQLDKANWKLQKFKGKLALLMDDDEGDAK